MSIRRARSVRTPRPASPFAAWGERLLDNGYSPVPLKPVVRTPLLRKWDRLREKALSRDDIERLTKVNPDLGLGVAGGFNCLLPIDVDTDDREILNAVLGVLPRPTVGKRGSKGWTAFFWDSTGLIDARKFVVPETKAPIVEILTTGVATIPPTVHPKLGRPYHWLRKATLFNTQIDDLPEITPDHIVALEKALRPWVPERPIWVPRVVNSDEPKASDKRMVAYARTVLRSAASELASMSSGGRNLELFNAACKLGRYVHHRVLAECEFESELMAACSSNGLFREDGQRNCLATIRSGLAKSRNDGLPVLENRRKS